MFRTLLIITPAVLATMAGAQSYHFTDLGTLAGQSNAFALSSTGTVGGTSTMSDSHFRAVLFPGADPPFKVAGVAAEREHVVFTFDPSGRPIGTSYTLGGMGVSAFRLDPEGPTLLGPFAARSANASGDVAGTTRVVASDGMTLPIACSFHAGTLTTLPGLGGKTSQALGIDDLGRVVGSATTANEATSHPCIWTSPTRVLDLGTLGGASGQASASVANLASGESSVVGYSIKTADGLRHATLWRVNAAGNVASRTDLGVLRAGTSSYALSINHAGDAVGTSDFQAVLFRNGQVLDLNQLVLQLPTGWTLESAAAINDAGQIAGTGTYLGVPRAFRLDPPGCAADFNQDGGVDGADVGAFFLAWEGGESNADVNLDGGVDGSDVDAFFALWSQGGC